MIAQEGCAKYNWSPIAQKAFESVKQALTQAPVLKLPDFTQQFVVQIDACDKGIGAVLLQQGHPISFLSKALEPRAQALSTYEKECLAILLAVQKWRPYLKHPEFIIQTDHRSLVYLGEQQLTTSIQHKAFVKLMGLQYKIQYKKGAENIVADALSRQEVAEEFGAISSGKPRWMEIVIEGYADNAEAQRLLTSLSLNPEGEPVFQLTDEYLGGRERFGWGII